MSKRRNIDRVLVANRGEIAVRIIRACRELGIEAVAVASEADRFALHAQLADRVVDIGPAPPTESYLRFDAVLEAAHKTMCDAVHPGYGFLAENPEFARAAQKAGLVFIGPSAEVIEEMGVKTQARQRMAEAGVPVVPGGTLPEGDDEAGWKAAAAEVGYPLLVKAAAGGGGKGMRAVTAEGDLVAAIGSARREALSAFGDGTVYLERLLQRPRHIEVQILADEHGRVLHLGERECSIQRRHQKIIEESPAPGLSDELRGEMTAAAVRAAEAVGYTGAGTVEMLLDSDGQFYFLEMNTRLQVEHPVTEWVTGIDLVAQQIRVAQGHRLEWKQEDVRQRGHSIEARLYAEDPASGFLPQTGSVLLFDSPGGPGVRVDTGIVTGAEISLHYDPMVAKLSSWAQDRDAARRRLLAALRQTVLLGVNTNLSYLAAILDHEEFAAGQTHTGFLPQHFEGWTGVDGEADDDLLGAAAVLLGKSPAAFPGNGADDVAGPADLWSTLGPLRVGQRRA